MTTETTQNVVTINGKEYEIDKLSDTAKSLLQIFNQWQADRDEAANALTKAKINLAKNEAALRDLSREIVELIENEEAAPAA